MGSPSEPVDPAEAEQILRTLAQVPGLVLIGGQAVHYWTARYMARNSDLRAAAPFTTKDIDFVGTIEQAEQCSRMLGGEFRPMKFGQRTICTAIIKLPSGVQVDFLQSPLGIPDVEELHKLSIPYELGRVMHPIHVLESRVANVAELDKYQTDRGLKQLRGSITCMRELLLEMLDQPDANDRPVRTALKLCERVFAIAESNNGIRVYEAHGIDPLEAAITDDDRMPDFYRTRRLPQVRRQLALKRKE